MAATSSYPANGSVASFIFYLQFQVNITSQGGKTFNGKAGGISSPGGGALFGDVYTDDLDKLYSDTHSFEFQSLPVYLSILFFDKDSNLLGHFQSGSSRRSPALAEAPATGPDRVPHPGRPVTQIGRSPHRA